MIAQLRVQELISALEGVQDLEILDANSDRERFSQDFFDYSPVLKSQLNSCLADLIVRPHSIEAVVCVAKVC